MRIVAFPNQSGSRHWRIEAPFRYLRRAGIDARVSNEGINEEIAKWADVYLLQGCVDKDGIALLYQYQQEQGKKIIVDMDDALVVEDDNIHKIEHEASNAIEIIKKTLEIADLVTTTTKHLAHELSPFAKNIKVLPNYVDLDFWEKSYRPNDSGTVRIGWAGSTTHVQDLKMIEKPLKEILEKYSKTKLIIVGDPRISDLFKGYSVEGMLGVSLEAWPDRLSGLRLDIGIAPLRDSEFNRCKSNIKWQEYGINRIPGIFSPTVYNHRGFDGHLGLVCETEDQWFRALENLITRPDLRQEIAHSAYTMVKKRYSLEDRIDNWISAYTDLTTNIV